MVGKGHEEISTGLQDIQDEISVVDKVAQRVKTGSRASKIIKLTFEARLPALVPMVPS
jgi:hypothetical protein